MKLEQCHLQSVYVCAHQCDGCRVFQLVMAQLQGLVIYCRNQSPSQKRDQAIVEMLKTSPRELLKCCQRQLGSHIEGEGELTALPA